MDIIVGELIIEEDRHEHISKHKVTIEEVLEIVNGDYVYIDGKLGRWLLIGKTKKKRFLTVVVGERNKRSFSSNKKNSYGLVTARPSSKEERSFYNEFAILRT